MKEWTKYRTAKRQACAEFVERKSRFIGWAKPVTSDEEAVAFINSVKAEHREATHNVYAYSLRTGQIKRYSDDGEPQGTAGIPTLDVILKSEVTDVAVVVTRYFGGILLGTGGLVRAYSHAASIALEQAGIVTMHPGVTARVSCDYASYGKIASLIPENGGVIDDTVFTEAVEILFHIGVERVSDFQRQLADATCGKYSAEIQTQKYFEDF
ncbi:MAG: YigZ family protein [Ruminococcaceae bacterium]|nr:YigZ family protein [Oscillospiraceae bacterium]